MGSSVIALWADEAKDEPVTRSRSQAPRPALLCSRQQPLAGLCLGCGRRCGTGIFVDKLPSS